MEIGRFWASDGKDTLSDDLEALGIQVPNSLRRPVTFPVLPENWEALQIFLACQSQWRVSPMGVLTGIDYGSVSAVMQMRQVPPTEQAKRLDEVQRIERGALLEKRGEFDAEMRRQERRHQQMMARYDELEAQLDALNG
ncbi:DUF1799 domain-containing protein [Modicisalibacter sp. MOD 31.J]|uniref:DUF1799 domain-containing protein n=1 Tax=Modicisalibacter sp. MOD 31.J TaxID=2831897 RepID=UPI001CCC4746|nr:DUF1799 domain-containing protein [Modicisalibacter sp. MOD 31.J]MBZ9574420.1 DUF1799 domain-containing protein [Modicisalibacter sp. MOD 31.J]